MVIQKRCLLWDWTNTNGVPAAMDEAHFGGPMKSWTPPELKNRAPFRPMIHDMAKLSGDDWNRIKSLEDSIILNFNEPERAGVSVQQAADAWFKQIVALRTQQGNKLVSPSCASDPNGRQWIADFMTRVESDPPDFLGVHYYGTDSKEAIKYLEDMHAQFPHQPLFITEVASISRNYQDVLAFTVEIANWMDGTDFVEEYGFFGCMRAVADDFVSPEAQLMKSDGQFTDLMYKLMYDQPMKV